MEKIYLKGTDIAELIRASSTLKSNEMISGTLGEQRKRKDFGTVIVPVFYADNKTSLKEEKKITDTVNQKFHLIKCSICKILENIVASIEGLSAREDNLDKVYQDCDGKRYSVDEDGYKIYIDNRGFNYYIKYIPDLGKEFSYIKLYDQESNMTIGTFIDEERTMIYVEGSVYPMDLNGNILYDEEIPYLGPKL